MLQVRQSRPYAIIEVSGDAVGKLIEDDRHCA